MNKIIFLDIDGTIRNFDGVIPQSAVNAIRKAKQNGHQVCISSGRPYNQIEEKVLDIGFDGIISSAGGNVIYQGECIAQNCFDQMVYLGLAEYLLEHGCVLELQRCDKTFVPASVYDEYVEIGRRLMEKAGSKENILREFPQSIDDWREITNLEKMLFFSNELSYDTIAKKWDGKIHMTSFSMPNSERWGGEISPPGIMKTAGIQKILKVSGFTQKDVIAVGDSDNDIDMLEFADIGIAMGNGTKSAKAAADMITASVMEDGIEKAFCQLSLI